MKKNLGLLAVAALAVTGDGCELSCLPGPGPGGLCTDVKQREDDLAACRPGGVLYGEVELLQIVGDKQVGAPGAGSRAVRMDR